MKLFTSTLSARFAAGALMSLALAFTASSASAQYGRDRDSRDQILRWSGSVDREIQIQVDNRRANVYEVGSNERARRRVNITGSSPNRPGRLYVQVLEGRGRVDVIEQPSSRNGYRATIRLRDPHGGASRYRKAAYWEGDRRVNGRRN